MVFYAHNLFDNLINVKRIYNDDGNLRKNKKFFFDFRVDYTRGDSFGEEYLDNLETETVDQTHEFDREWLLGGDGDRILSFIYHILDLLEVPCYYEIVSTLTDIIVDLKKCGATSELPHVERLEVLMFVVMPRFPGEEDDVDVKFAEAPASDEAVETHLETVVVENEGYCMICMDKIRVGSDVERSGLGIVGIVRCVVPCRGSVLNG